MCLLLFTTPSYEAIAAEKENSHFNEEVIDIHVTMYYHLLAQKFSPYQVKVWDEIKQEQNILKKKIEELHKAGALLHGDKVEHTWIERHQQLQRALTKAVKEYDEEALKEILPKIFEHQRELNEKMKEKIKMAK